MGSKRDLDETDLEIVRLLAEDARRPFSDVAERVGLSAPAVSDRVGRLEAQGVIRSFTIDVDRTKLQRRTAMLLIVEAVPGNAGRIYERLSEANGVEHVFKTYSGRVVAHASAPEHDVDEWLRAALDLEWVRDYHVELLDRHTWNVDIDGAEFTLECPVCGMTVTGDGVTAEIGGEVRTFCCPSCEAEYREEYETRKQGLS